MTRWVVEALFTPFEAWRKAVSTVHAARVSFCIASSFIEVLNVPLHCWILFLEVALKRAMYPRVNTTNATITQQATPRDAPNGEVMGRITVWS